MKSTAKTWLISKPDAYFKKEPRLTEMSCQPHILLLFLVAYTLTSSAFGQEHLQRDSVPYPIPNSASAPPFSVSIDGKERSRAEQETS